MTIDNKSSRNNKHFGIADRYLQSEQWFWVADLNCGTDCVTCMGHNMSVVPTRHIPSLSAASLAVSPQPPTFVHPVPSRALQEPRPSHGLYLCGTRTIRVRERSPLHFTGM